MPDSRPPIFDDGGGLPDVDRSRAAEHHDDDVQLDFRGPNYLVRRAIVVGLGVTVVALGAIGVGALLSGDDHGSNSASAGADWNTIVTVDDITGSVVLANDDGEESERIRVGIRPLTDARVSATTMVATTATGLALVPLRDQTATTTIDIESSGPLLMPSGSAHTLIAHDAVAQRAVLVHGPTGESIDTAAFDTIAGARYDLAFARSDPAGRNVLVTDTGNFQSVLFSFDRDAPSFFPGLALAVNDTLVVTAQNVGTDATITVFDHAGDTVVSGRTPSVRAGMLIDGAVVLVTVDGQVVLLALDDGGVTDGTQLEVGTVTAGYVAVRGDRLVVVGEDGSAVLDDAGDLLVDLPGAVPTTSGIDVGAPRRSACLIATRDTLGEIVVVDLADGTILTEAIADDDVLAPTDGCEPVVATSTGYLVLARDGVLRATVAGELVALSPDGRSVVVDHDNRLELLPRFTDDDGAEVAEPVDIGRSGRHVLFADL